MRRAATLMHRTDAWYSKVEVTEYSHRIGKSGPTRLLGLDLCLAQLLRVCRTTRPISLHHPAYPVVCVAWCLHNHATLTSIASELQRRPNPPDRRLN
jgi:hypothetical protein